MILKLPFQSKSCGNLSALALIAFITISGSTITISEAIRI